MKTTTVFSCQNCGAQAPKWMGQCSECGKWGTLAEELIAETKEPKAGRIGNKAELVELGKIKENQIKRIATGIGEVDRVLGNGIVPGSVVLFAGEPGIGKSTLLTQIALNLVDTKAGNRQTVIYICGEESPDQVKMRISRLTAVGKTGELNNFFLFPETNVDQIISNVKTQMLKPKLKTQNSVILIIDSIQTLYTDDLTGVAGSIGQVRESTRRLIELAKNYQVPVFLVGHVTKQGSLAGPKTIEHAVDTVLYFEGERSQDLRLLRSVKNRFGPTDEVGVFQMGDKGLIEVTDPSFILSKTGSGPKIGSAMTIVFEGTRPMVVEIQSLVTKSFSPLPKRIINGLDRRRAEMLIAIVQKHLKLPLWEYDVFLNVAGGFKVFEPAADLAVCAAIYSSYKNKPFIEVSPLVGEVSLLGEIKEVGQTEKRIKQARAVGFKQVFDATRLSNVYGIKRLIKS